MSGRDVTLELGGEDRKLRYDLNAIALIGEKLDLRVRLNKLGEDLMGKPLPLSSIRTIVWAGLRHEDKDLTEEEVGSWIDQDNLGEVVEGFMRLFGDTLSDEEIEKATADLLGETSGASVSPIEAAS